MIGQIHPSCCGILPLADIRLTGVVSIRKPLFGSRNLDGVMGKLLCECNYRLLVPTRVGSVATADVRHRNGTFKENCDFMKDGYWVSHRSEFRVWILLYELSGVAGLNKVSNRYAYQYLILTAFATLQLVLLEIYYILNIKIFVVLKLIYNWKQSYNNL